MNEMRRVVYNEWDELGGKVLGGLSEGGELCTAVHRLWKNNRIAEFKGLYFLKCLSSH